MNRPSPASALRTPRLLLEALEDRLLLDSSLLTHLTTEDYWQNQIVVQFAENATPEALGGTTLGHELSLVPGLFQVNVPEELDLASVLDIYANDPRVVYAQPNYVIRSNALPNDPLINNQWPIRNNNPLLTIQAEAAWDQTTGSGRTIVAVIDTGVDFTHPDIAPNMWRNTAEISGNGIDDDGNGYVDDVFGYNFVNNNGNVMDLHGHGTHVAGILGAKGNNGIGITGVNWNVQIMALRFLDANGRGSTSDALRALNYAVQMGATISNNSWTSPAYDAALETGIRNAGAAGHIYVTAAGNSGTNISVNKVYPASYEADNLITVAALDSSNRLAGWSNRGPLVDIAAPGASIFSTLPNGKYGYMSGTSMAAPFVTGAVALVRDQNPTWTAQQVIQRVLTTADNLSSLNGLIAGGKLNLGAAVTTGQSNPPPPPPADTTGAQVTAISSILSNNRMVGLRITFSEPIQAGSFTSQQVLELTGPAGPLAITAIQPVGEGAIQFDIRFAEQSRTGLYSITLNTGILDLAGNPLNQNGNGINGENPADRYSGSVLYTASNTYHAPNMPAPIADFTTSSYSLPITDGMTIQNVRVQVHINHGWMSDMIIKLRAPDGTEVILANRRGRGGKGYHGTIFNDLASASIASGVGTFIGSYRPEQPLSRFRGMNSAGTWTLVIEDKARGDAGTITGWSLSFDAQAGNSSLTHTINSGAHRPDVLRTLLQRASTFSPVLHSNTLRFSTQDLRQLMVNQKTSDNPVMPLATKRQLQTQQLLTALRTDLRLTTGLKRL